MALVFAWAVPGPARAQVQVQDIAVESRFQGDFGGHFARGRALVAADFDLDGRIDFFIGNPGDESFILRNVQRAGRTQFLVTQILLKDALAWGASTADYDNDGDYDIYVTTGANEGEGLDYLFKNMFMEEGSLRFEDVSAEAGIQGPLDLNGEPVVTASANADWGDYDLDGDVDLFVSVNRWNGSIMGGPRFEEANREMSPMLLNAGDYAFGNNILYRNNGDGTFTDVTKEVGLTKAKSTRHSTWIDVDNDGDLDLYENNFSDLNYLWRNRLVETGIPSFEEVTLDFSPEGENLYFPQNSFVSCAADFNQDGWDDLMIFTQGKGPERNSPYEQGHAIFINDGGTGFRNMGDASGINQNYVSTIHHGVMGSQIGDVNADGVPDIYIGNGGPSFGVNDQFFLSTSAVGANPVYEDATAMIDFEAPVNARTTANYPDYPYRTHGTAFVDVDGDGLLEMAVINGGPAFDPDDN
ncbi:FG-GAP repeat domain-containing protein, partial [Rhodocaloribacter sp.]